MTGLDCSAFCVALPIAVLIARIPTEWAIKEEDHLLLIQKRLFGLLIKMIPCFSCIQMSCEGLQSYDSSLYGT